MADKEKKAQELYMEFQVFDQHIKQVQQQLEAVTHQLIELSSTRNSLDELNKVMSGREVFVPISSGIFAKANLHETSELLVNVGASVLVKKDIDSTKSLIQKQFEELKKIHQQMAEDLEKMKNHAARMEVQLQGLVSEEQSS